MKNFKKEHLLYSSIILACCIYFFNYSIDYTGGGIFLKLSYLFFEIFDVYIAIVAVFFSFFGYIIIPLTNSARDRGWDNLFKWLHNLSVFNTVIIMIVAVVQIFRATTL